MLSVLVLSVSWSLYERTLRTQSGVEVLFCRGRCVGDNTPTISVHRRGVNETDLMEGVETGQVNRTQSRHLQAAGRSAGYGDSP